MDNENRLWMLLFRLQHILVCQQTFCWASIDIDADIVLVSTSICKRMILKKTILGLSFAV